MWEVKGYKAFNLDGSNKYGKVFIEGNTYHTAKDIQFYKSGYHLCTHLPHVYSYYFPAEEVKVAEVTGFGKHHYLNIDDYRGLYDMYAVENITIDHFLTRKEIITTVLNETPYNQKIFIYNSHLSKEEIKLFLERINDDYELLKAIFYYQMGYIDIYEKDIAEVRKLIREW